MATAGILITLGPARIYYMWAISQAVLSGHESLFVCAGPPPGKRVICFSLAGLQTVPVCYIPFLFLSTSPFTQLCPIWPLLLVLTLLLLFSETPTPPCYCPPHPSLLLFLAVWHPWLKISPWIQTSDHNWSGAMHLKPWCSAVPVRDVVELLHTGSSFSHGQPRASLA